MLTWLYDGTGCPAAILDEYCLRTSAGEPAAFVFGLSVFSLKGAHIGWFEEGVFFDIENKLLGFMLGAKGLPCEFPPPQPAPSMPVLSKRPLVPTLRARPARRPASGWSSHSLAEYIDPGGAAPSLAGLPPPVTRPGSGLGEIPR